MVRHRYRITIRGVLGEAGRQAFENFKIDSDGKNTILISDMNQDALYATLNRIQALGLELVGLSRLADLLPDALWGNLASAKPGQMSSSWRARWTASRRRRAGSLR